MAEIKWIKIATDMFDNRKIKQIEILPDSDAIIVIWVKILCLAGVINEEGCLLFTKEIPYTEELMATQFNRPINTIRLALKTFERFGMIEVIDSVIRISNWEKYQNIEGMEKVREQTRKRVANYRGRQKQALLEQCNVTETLRNATDIEEEKEKEIEKEVTQKRQPSETTDDLLNASNLSDKSKAALRDWIAYKKERREPYKPTGFKALITKMENLEKATGADGVVDAISNSMACGYKGIFPAKSKTGDNQPKKGFNNFIGRDYGDTEMDALEQALLAKRR